MIKKFFINLFGFKTPVDRKKTELAKLQQKAFEAQRNGDLALAGKYYLEAEMLETEIIEMAKEK